MSGTHFTLFALSRTFILTFLGGAIGFTASGLFHPSFQPGWFGFGAGITAILCLMAIACYIVLHDPYDAWTSAFKASPAYAQALQTWSILLAADLMGRGVIPYDDDSLFLPYVPAVIHKDQTRLSLLNDPCMTVTQRQAAAGLSFHHKLLFARITHSDIKLTKPSAHQLLAVRQRHAPSSPSNATTP